MNVCVCECVCLCVCLGPTPVCAEEFRESQFRASYDYSSASDGCEGFSFIHHPVLFYFPAKFHKNIKIILSEIKIQEIVVLIKNI